MLVIFFNCCGYRKKIILINYFERKQVITTGQGIDNYKELAAIVLSSAVSPYTIINTHQNKIKKKPYIYIYFRKHFGLFFKKYINEAF